MLCLSTVILCVNNFLNRPLLYSSPDIGIIIWMRRFQSDSPKKDVQKSKRISLINILNQLFYFHTYDDSVSMFSVTKRTQVYWRKPSAKQSPNQIGNPCSFLHTKSRVTRVYFNTFLVFFP